MAGRPYQAYPGRLGHNSNPSPYQSSSPQPGYGQQQSYSPYPSPNSEPPHGQQPKYSQPSYHRPPPPPPQQQQSGYGQQQPYGHSQSYQQQLPSGSQPPYPQTSGYGYGQQSQPGQYPPQGQYGGAPPPQQAGPQQIAAYRQTLLACIQENNLQHFYPPNSPVLDQIAARAASQVDQLCARWRVPREIGNDIAKLGLYDIILYIDDSGSMQFEEKGERIKDLDVILRRVAFAATLFDDDGISIRFMNGHPPSHLLENVKSEQQIDQLMANIQFRGLTPMGKELMERVIEPLVLRKARSGALRKPTLVITITDGQPAGESQNTIFDTIRTASETLRGMPQYGPGALSFQFAQVGNDEGAREFLAKLDGDPMVGHLVDCTSNYENESAEMAKANPPVDLTPELWLVKLLLGAIDKSYDRKDETTRSPPPAGGYGVPGQYGAPQYGAPQGQYGAPQGQYGAPQGYGQQQYPPQQQGQHGAPQGYPPQQQQGYPPQQQFGRPPQQGYNPQQGGYGAPPAPPRY